MTTKTHKTTTQRCKMTVAMQSDHRDKRKLFTISLLMIQRRQKYICWQERLTKIFKVELLLVAGLL